MLDAQLQAAIAQAILAAQAAGDLPAFDLPTTIPVEHPKQASAGDYATPVCLQLAKLARLAPLAIAQRVAAHMPALPFVGAVEVAAPGFLNFRLDSAWLASQVDALLAPDASIGRIDLGHGATVQVEFVSANPTGPLHVGSARNAVLGDTIASVLDAAGYAVQREYYVNDAGSRIRVFNETLFARYAQALGHDLPIPEDGYHGAYMTEWGADLAREHGSRFWEMEREAAVDAIGPLGLQRVLDEARNDLAAMSIHYDRWFSEQSLYDDGQFAQVFALLQKGGYVYEQDGATWFRATDLGDTKDEVIVRTSGGPGYFASDIAYHYNKFVGRGFERVIDVWGADHQGHVPRMKAMMRALGLDPERLIFVLYQLVTLKRGGEIVRLSKRTGDTITLREVIDEVGPDAVRYFLLSRSADSQMDFDLDLAKKQTDENPVFYIQYAHARICSILRRATDLDLQGGDVGLLTSEPELALIRQMLRLPEVIQTAANALAPHHLPYYAYELAAALHTFYRDCRVVSSDPADLAISRARIKLVSACRLVLARVLGIMGMSAPEQM